MAVWMRILASRVRAWLSSDRGDEEFERELASHVEMLAEENVRRGMARDEARREARVRLGGIAQLKETNRELRGLPLLDTLVQDARYALRMLRKNPGFTAIAVLTLALGIGANTAMFSVVYAVLLKPLPYPDSGRLFSVSQAKPQKGLGGLGWSYPNFEDLHHQNRVFSAVAGNQNHQLTLTGRGEPSVVDTVVVTADFFAVFGEAPLAGRIFTPADGKPGAPAVVMLSEGLWRAKFGGDPSVIGSAVDLDMKPYTVAGVMPAGFRFPLLAKSEQVWIPVIQDPVFAKFLPFRQGHLLQVTARLKPGVSEERARAELDALAAQFAGEHPAENAGWQIRIQPLQSVLATEVRPALVVLLGAVGLVLLIACANIVNLLLARATARAKEIALRATLGAGRARIVRQLLTESAVLCLAGGVAGVALAYWGVAGLSALLPASLPRVNAIRIDYGVLGFALALCVFASGAVGLVPALFAARASLPKTIREGGGRSGESAAGRRARSTFAAAEIALAVVLLMGAGLLLRSFSKLTEVNPGFEAQNVVRAEISLPQAKYSKPQQWDAFCGEFLQRLQAEPGMQDSALVIPAPIVDRQVPVRFEIEGRPASSADASRQADYASVSPGYFRVMEIPLEAGRLLDERDAMESPKVGVISKALARIYFPHENPVGKQLRFAAVPSGDVATAEIVGVVGDVRNVALGSDPGPLIYVPFAQSPFWGTEVVVRSTLGTASVVAAIRREASGLDTSVPVSDVGTMNGIVSESVAQPRVRTLLLAIFAALALVLAASGIFGVISYSVECRTREIGVRVALGASRGAILRMVSRETALLAFAGLALGIPAALAACRLLGHLLFGVGANDPVAMGAAAIVLVAVAAAAAYAPVRRAMQVDPLEALRQE